MRSLLVPWGTHLGSPTLSVRPNTWLYWVQTAADVSHHRLDSKSDRLLGIPTFRVPPSLYGWHPGCKVAPASVVPKLNTLFLMFTNLRNRAQQDRGPWTYEKWAVQILSRTHRALDPEEPHHAKTDWTLHLPLIQSVAAWTKTRVSSRNSRDVLFPHPCGGHAERHPDLRLIWWFLLICHSLLRNMHHVRRCYAP